MIKVVQKDHARRLKEAKDMIEAQPKNVKGDNLGRNILVH